MKRGPSPNSIIIFWGLHVANCHVGDKGVCYCRCWASLVLGKKKRRATLSWSGRALHVSAVEMHGVIRGERCLHVFCFLFQHLWLCIWSITFEWRSSHFFTGLTSFFNLMVLVPVAGILRPLGRRPMRKGRSGWGPTPQEGSRTRAANPRCLLREHRAPPLGNTTIPTCVGPQDELIWMTWLASSECSALICLVFHHLA